MYAFSYHRASGLRQAGNLLAKLDDPKLLAGGQTLLPTMKQRLASPANLVDLSSVEGMSGIELKGRSLVIGAMTKHADVANSPIVQENLPALAALAGMIGDPAVRHRGTIGGSIANNDPNADYPAACSRSWRDNRNLEAQDHRRTSSSKGCSKPRLSRTRLSSRSRSRSPRRRAITSSATRPRASRWLVCSSPRSRRKSVSPSQAPADRACSVFRRSKRR